MTMYETYQRGYDAGYEEGAKFGKIPWGAVLVLFWVGVAVGMGVAALAHWL